MDRRDMLVGSLVTTIGWQAAASTGRQALGCANTALASAFRHRPGSDTVGNDHVIRSFEKSGYQRISPTSGWRPAAPAHQVCDEILAGSDKRDTCRQRGCAEADTKPAEPSGYLIRYQRGQRTDTDDLLTCVSSDHTFSRDCSASRRCVTSMTAPTHSSWPSS